MVDACTSFSKGLHSSSTSSSINHIGLIINASLAGSIWLFYQAPLSHFRHGSEVWYALQLTTVITHLHIGCQCRLRGKVISTLYLATSQFD